ncbi:MAG TPA: hypothetical protein VNZ01_00210 [Solirubrobacteraceae bacterium]|nr:hypothetical protein [Solirubrobacteraceae bacterium]
MTPLVIQEVTPRMVAAFPALGKPLDASEAQQLPAVAQVMNKLASEDEVNTAGANSALARRISHVGEDAEYLVPGNEVVCMVSIAVGQATGGGCARASSVETAGTTSLTVIPAGYQVTGILPTGTGEVNITDAGGHRTTVVANANRAFRFLSATPLAYLAYELPGGGQHVGSLALPPPPDAPSAPGA